jgi:hypothetical protein
MPETDIVTGQPIIDPTAGLAVAQNTAGQNVDANGMPVSDSSPAAPSNVDMADPDSTPSPAGFMGSIESFGSSIVNGAENAVKTVYGGAKTVAGDVVGGAEGVVSKGVGTVTGAASSLTMDIVIILAVVGIALVYVAQSGAVKISR